MTIASSPSPARLPFSAIAVFLTACAMVGVGMFVAGRLTPVLVNDSPGYLDFPFESLSAALSDMRTPGYPLFLRLLGVVSASHTLIPIAQYVAYCGGCLVFLWGLHRLSDECWLSVGASVGLLATNILHGYVETIATDTLAAAMALCVVGLLLGYVRQNGGAWGVLALLTLALFAVWQIRPAYLCLVLFVPILGGLLTLAKLSTGDQRHSWLRTVITLSVIGIAPLLVWCSLRWAVVGKFGVVAFGGYNLAGIAGQFLDEELVERLPASQQAFARAALEERERLPREMIPMSDADRLNYARIEANYDITIWTIFTPAARRLYGDNPRDINPRLRRLAVEIIREQPRDYGIWLLKSTRQAVRKLLSDFAVNPAGLLMIAVGTFIALVTSTLRDDRRPHIDYGQNGCRILTLTALLYAMMQIAETILVCPPLGRFTDAAALFLPALGMALLIRWGNNAAQRLRH